MSTTFKNWRDKLSSLFVEQYVLTLEDLGYEEARLRLWWESRETPQEVVDWVAAKYGLTSCFEVMIYRD